jgi:hypothetical protein
MAMFEHEIRTREGACPTHGRVTARSGCTAQVSVFRDGCRARRGGASAVSLPLMWGQGGMKRFVR